MEEIVASEWDEVRREATDLLLRIIKEIRRRESIKVQLKYIFT